jgi:hypothetical protein
MSSTSALDNDTPAQPNAHEATSTSTNTKQTIENVIPKPASATATEPAKSESVEVDEWALYHDPDFPGYGRSRSNAYFDYVEQFLDLPNTEIKLADIKLVAFERFAGDVDSSYRLHKFQAIQNGEVLGTAVERKMYLAKGAAASDALRKLGKLPESSTEDWTVHADPTDPVDKAERDAMYIQCIAGFSQLPNATFKLSGRWRDSTQPRHRCEAMLDGKVVAVAIGTSKNHAKGAASKIALLARGATIGTRKLD